MEISTTQFRAIAAVLCLLGVAVLLALDVHVMRTPADITILGGLAIYFGVMTVWVYVTGEEPTGLF